MTKRLLTILLIGGIAILSLSCSRGKFYGDLGEDLAPKANLSLERFILVETIRGEREWELEAARAEVFEERKETKASQVRIKFYKDGRCVSILQGREGLLNLDSRDMEIKGEVIAIADDGSKLETTRLIWVASQSKFITNEKVRIIKGENIITGLGLETEPNLSGLKIYKDVKVTVGNIEELGR